MISDIKAFDPERMTGVTEEDCERIEKALSDGLSLYVDDNMRVVDETPLYIASAADVGKGKGILYRELKK